jgi:hypothetical protein
MRNFLLTALAAATLCGAGMGEAVGQASRDGKSRWVMLSNQSDFTAYQVYMIPSGEDCCWSRDLLEDIFLGPSRTKESPGKSPKRNPESVQPVNFDDGSGACQVDIRITTKEYPGWDWYLANVNVCTDISRKDTNKRIILGGKLPSSQVMLKVKNESRLTAYNIYAIPTGQDCCWSHDLLGVRVVAAGSSSDVNFDGGKINCEAKTLTKLDIRVTSNKKGIDWYFDGVDVCSGPAKQFGLILKGERGDGQSRWMTIKNETNYVALGAFIIPTGADCCWSHDLLGSDVIQGGAALDVNFDDGTGACTFDIRVTRRDGGREWVFDKVNVCQQPALTLKPPEKGP